MQRHERGKGGVFLILSPRRADSFPKRRDLPDEAARRRAKRGLGVRRQVLLGNGNEPQPTRFAGADQRVAEEHPLGLVHPEMNGENFIGRPIGHRLADKDRARGYFVCSIGFSLQRRSHLAPGNAMRFVNASLDHVARPIRLQVFSGVIGLSRPRIVDELNAAPVYDGAVTVASGDDDEGCPA